MKSIVNVFFGLCMVFGLYGQNYAPDEFIVQYTASATPLEQQTLRNLYGITSFTEISAGDNIEVWTGISYPIHYTENGETTTINNTEELLWHITIQDGGQGETTARSDVQEGDLNFIFDLDNSGLLHNDGTFQPLPFCDEYANNRLFLPVSEGTPLDADVKIIIVDQYIPYMETTAFNTGPSDLGGTHGLKVYSVISNILSQANVGNVEYINYPVFDSNGVSTVASIIEVGVYIREQFESGIWDPTNEKVLVNLSANFIFPNSIEQDIPLLRDVWYKVFGQPSDPDEYPFDAMVISSAGNQNSFTSNIFPGGLSLVNEITVAGTQDCFSLPWTSTNHHRLHFEIAAEAENILTSDGTNFYLSNGTSYASAQVTATVAQLAAYMPQADLNRLKERLIAKSPSMPSLLETVKDGKVLALNLFSPNGNQGPDAQLVEYHALPGPLAIQTTPNPFSQTTLLRIQVPIGQSAQVSLYNTVGQVVHQIILPNEQELTELQWYTPNNLAKGTYVVRVQAGEQTQQQLIIKQ